MNDIYISELTKILENYADNAEDYEMLNNINIIDGMLNGTIIYNEEIINHIQNQYLEELQILANLERKLRSFQITENNSSAKSNEQNLLNLRHALVRVQIMRILKRKNKKILEDDLINNDNKKLYFKLVEILYN